MDEEGEYKILLKIEITRFIFFNVKLQYNVKNMVARRDFGETSQ